METRQRQTAFKVRISDLINGKYVTQGGWEPNYIFIDNNMVSRANIMGVVVSKNSSEPGQNETLVVDDGSGRIQARSFEETNFSDVKVGDVILLIGRPKEYGSEIFIVPEIIKKIENRRWIDVRKTELGSLKKDGKPAVPSEKNPEDARDGNQAQIISDDEEALYDEQKAAEDNPAEKIVSFIRNLDKGDGVEFDDILKSCGVENPEEMVSALLKRGDIFELRPGKLKVLE